MKWGFCGDELWQTFCLFSAFYARYVRLIEYVVEKVERQKCLGHHFSFISIVFVRLRKRTKLSRRRMVHCAWCKLHKLFSFQVATHFTTTSDRVSIELLNKALDDWYVKDGVSCTSFVFLFDFNDACTDEIQFLGIRNDLYGIENHQIIQLRLRFCFY